jgi:hypothetical protein
VAGLTCLYPSSPESTFYIDLDEPEPGGAYYYLVRATNDCPLGDGSVGTGSEDPRVAASCP